MTRKNLTKSYEQRLRLQTYYEQTDGLWTRQQLNAFADTIGLSRQRVYKWLWDKRNMDKKKPPQIKIQPRRVKRQAKPKAPAMHEFAIGSSEIRVPKDLRNAVQFKAIYPIPSWMRHTLKKVGWQLIQDSNSQFPKLPPEPQPYIKMYQEQMKEGQSSKWLMLRPSKFELVEQDCQEMPHMQCNFSSNFMQVENEEKGRTFDKYTKEGLGPCKIQRKEASDAIYQPES